MANNKEIKIASALAFIEKSKCLDALLEGKVIETNDNAHFSTNGQRGARGGSILKYLRNAVNDVVMYHTNGGIEKIPVAEINFGNQTIRIKPQYIETFRRVMANYGKAK